METKQPIWKQVGTVGDIHPLDYSGGFIYIDTTGVYCPELEWIESEDSELAEPVKWTVYRILLERCKLSSFDADAHLICGRYQLDWPYPQEKYVEWFDAGLESVAASNGVELATLRNEFTSTDPIILADAYLALAQYHGWENFDSDPLTFTDRSELEQRYKVRNQ